MRMRAAWKALVVVLVLVLADLAFLATRWPFTEQRVIKSLRGSTSSDVTATGFHMQFFPGPGCTLEAVTFTRGGQRIATAERIRMKSSWVYALMLQKRITRFEVDRLDVHIPHPMPAGIEASSGGQSVIEELIADGATLEIAAKRPVRFGFPKLRATNVGSGKQIGFESSVSNPNSRGELVVSGAIGPFQSGNRKETPLSGSFKLNNADLSQYKGLGGILEAVGKFNGKLGSLGVEGSTTVAGFEVNRSGHPMQLATTYRATVNGTNGHVVLNAVEADFLRTHLSVTGEVKDKHVAVDFTGSKARIEDLLRMFSKAPTPALRGPIVLRAHAELPNTADPFIRRLRLNGTFSINDAVWAKPATQAKVNELSTRARGETDETPDRVVTDLKGSVTMRGGTAELKGVTFRVPGAVATGGGVYNLVTKNVDLKGTVDLEANVSEATGGIKSVLLKPFNFMFRRKGDKRGAKLPVSITGKYPRPQYKVGLTK